jgi:hypothetical protein
MIPNPVANLAHELFGSLTELSFIVGPMLALTWGVSRPFSRTNWFRVLTCSFLVIHLALMSTSSKVLQGPWPQALYMILIFSILFYAIPYEIGIVITRISLKPRWLYPATLVASATLTLGLLYISDGAPSKEKNQLKPELKQLTKTLFNEARDAYVTGDYVGCLDRLTRLRKHIPVYENSKDLAIFCIEGAQLTGDIQSAFRIPASMLKKRPAPPPQ